MAKTVESRVGRRISGRETLVGTSPRAARRRYGVRLHPRAVDATGRRVAFADGTDLEVGTVVWATGFGLDQSFVQAPVLDDRGRIVDARGVTTTPGSTCWACPGSTPAARRCSAGSATTPTTWPGASPRWDGARRAGRRPPSRSPTA
jgi:hypothetical protein